MTTARLLVALVPNQIVVEGDELVAERDLPPGLLSRLEILHTGVRAVLTGKKWQGSTVPDGARPRVLELDPSKPIPLRIMFLCVEGDPLWDRIPASARLDLPDLFTPAER